MADVATLREANARQAAPGQVAVGRFGQKVRRNLSAYGFLIGAILCFTFFSWYPIVREVILSFQKAVYGGGYTWAGWINYDRIIHDPTFWLAWRNTLEFTLLALVVGYAVPFCVAILLNELRHAQGYLRVLVYLPVMLPPASALLLFAYFYNPSVRPVRRHLAHSAPPDVAVGLPARHRLYQHGDDLGGDRVDLDEHGRRHADLPGCTAEHPRRAL